MEWSAPHKSGEGLGRGGEVCEEALRWDPN